MSHSFSPSSRGQYLRKKKIAKRGRERNKPRNERETYGEKEGERESEVRKVSLSFLLEMLCVGSESNNFMVRKGFYDSWFNLEIIPSLDSYVNEYVYDLNFFQTFVFNSFVPFQLYTSRQDSLI